MISLLLKRKFLLGKRTSFPIDEFLYYSCKRKRKSIQIYLLIYIFLFNIFLRRDFNDLAIYKTKKRFFLILEMEDHPFHNKVKVWFLRYKCLCNHGGAQLWEISWKIKFFLFALYYFFAICNFVSYRKEACSIW